MEIGNIVEGHINELLGLNKNYYDERIKICVHCPLYSLVLGGICNSKLWLDVKTGDVSPVERPGYIRGCGCRLRAKLTIPSSKCPTGQW